MIYRKETSFHVNVLYDDCIWLIIGTYYYAPNEEYGESPNIFIQNDSKLIISDIYDDENNSGMFLLKEYKLFLDEVEELVWEQLLSEDE